MRLIDADALQILFNEVSTSLLGKAERHKDTEHMVRAFLMTTEMIQDAPTVDAVPVIRCKDCKNGKHWKNAFGIDGFKCDLLCVDISPEAFCSYGERKENENV